MWTSMGGVGRFGLLGKLPKVAGGVQSGRAARGLRDEGGGDVCGTRNLVGLFRTWGGGETEGFWWREARK